MVECNCFGGLAKIRGPPGDGCPNLCRRRRPSAWRADRRRARFGGSPSPAPQDRVGIVLLVACLAGLGWFCWQLLRQNGRLLVRLEAEDPSTGARGTGLASLPPLEAGTVAPPFSARDLDGEPVSLSSLLSPGLPVALFFTNPGCGACEAALEIVAKVQRDRAHELTLAVISGGSIDRIKAKATEFGLDRVVPQTDEALFDDYRVQGVPGVVAIDAAGAISTPAALGIDAVRRVILGEETHRPADGLVLAVSPTKAAATVEAAIDPYRAPLADGFREFTSALLRLAKSNAKHAGTFNGPSNQDAAALEALARWRRPAKQALARVKAVPRDAPGKNLAERWLRSLSRASTFNVRRCPSSIPQGGAGGRPRRPTDRRIASPRTPPGPGAPVSNEPKRGQRWLDSIARWSAGGRGDVGSAAAREANGPDPSGGTPPDGAADGDGGRGIAVVAPARLLRPSDAGAIDTNSPLEKCILDNYTSVYNDQGLHAPAARRRRGHLRIHRPGRNPSAGTEKALGASADQEEPREEQARTGPRQKAVDFCNALFLEERANGEAKCQSAPPEAPGGGEPGGGGGGGSTGCEPGSVLCGDYCCNLEYATCAGCNGTPICCRTGGN